MHSAPRPAPGPAVHSLPGPTHWLALEGLPEIQLRLYLRDPSRNGDRDPFRGRSPEASLLRSVWEGSPGPWDLPRRHRVSPQGCSVA